MAATQASHQFSGRCSAHSGRSIRMSSWGAVQPARTAPRPSTRSARVLPVPMSMPSHIEFMVAQMAGSGTWYRRLSGMKFRPVLDPEFVPASLWNRLYRTRVRESGGDHNLAIALERSDGSISVFRTAVLSHEGKNVAINNRYVERLLKFLLWQKGGCRVTIGGDAHIAYYLRSVYAPEGARAFDYQFMGERVYGRPMTIGNT